MSSKIKKQKVEVYFVVKRIWELDENETIDDVKSMLSDEAGEYLYGGNSGEEKIEVTVNYIE